MAPVLGWPSVSLKSTDPVRKEPDCAHDRLRETVEEEDCVIGEEKHEG